jgi:hypothetical protein
MGSDSFKFQVFSFKMKQLGNMQTLKARWGNEAPPDACPNLCQSVKSVVNSPKRPGRPRSLDA